MKLKIAILCSGAPHHKFLMNCLYKDFNVVSIVVEPNACKVDRLRSRKKYYDYFCNIYHEFRRSFTGLDEYRANFFKIDNYNVPDSLITYTDSINSNKVVDQLLNCKPDIIIVMSTSILKKQVLSTAKTIINIHGGFLPFYKGNHCFFFAYINRDWDKIGSTIHFVNEGIDEGDIIENIIPHKILPTDTPESLYCKCDKKAILRLITHLHNYENGIAFPHIKQEKIGKLYYTKDRHIWHELKYLIIKHILLIFPKIYK